MVTKVGHINFMFRPHPYPAAGSATVQLGKNVNFQVLSPFKFLHINIDICWHMWCRSFRRFQTWWHRLICPNTSQTFWVASHITLVTSSIYQYLKSCLQWQIYNFGSFSRSLRENLVAPLNWHCLSNTLDPPLVCTTQVLNVNCHNSYNSKNCNNATIGIRGFTMWKPKIPVTKCYPNEYWTTDHFKLQLLQIRQQLNSLRISGTLNWPCSN